MDITNEGEFQFYYWNYGYPRYFWYIITTVYLKDDNRVVAEYYVFTDDENIRLIEGSITSTETVLNLAGMDFFNEALIQTQSQIKSKVFTSREQEKQYLQSHSLSPVLCEKGEILQWYLKPNLKKNLENIENKSGCMSLRDYLKPLRSLKLEIRREF